MNPKRSWDLLSKATRQKSIEEIIRFSQNELDQPMGIITAEAFLDLFLQIAGNELHNNGVMECEKLLEERFNDLKVDIHILRKEA